MKDAEGDRKESAYKRKSSSIKQIGDLKNSLKCVSKFSIDSFHEKGKSHLMPGLTGPELPETTNSYGCSRLIKKQPNMFFPPKHEAKLPRVNTDHKQAKGRICCNCKKSQCLKLYCECFYNKKFCAGCNCTNCLNTKDNEVERNQAIKATQERNPNAFDPKILKENILV